MQQMPNHEKTLNAVAGKQSREEGTDRSSDQFQEEENTMTPTVPRIPAHFETAINVAGLTVAPGVMTGGSQPDQTVVALSGTGLRISFSTAEACALAAALQAVAVHLMESEQTERKAA